MPPESIDAIVIGYGNSWRGDDGAGPDVALRIEAMGLPRVRTLAVHQLTPELAEALSFAKRAYFVDVTIASREEPVVVEPLTAECANPLATHTFDPRALLWLAQVLYGRSPRAWLVTISGNQFNPGTTLSAVVRTHAEQAALRLARWIQQAEPTERP